MPSICRRDSRGGGERDLAADAGGEIEVAEAVVLLRISPRSLSTSARASFMVAIHAYTWGSDAGEVIAHAHVEDRGVPWSRPPRGPAGSPRQDVHQHRPFTYSRRLCSSRSSWLHSTFVAHDRHVDAGAGMVSRSLTCTVLSSGSGCRPAMRSAMFCAAGRAVPRGPHGLAARAAVEAHASCRARVSVGQNLRAGRSKTFPRARGRGEPWRSSARAARDPALPPRRVYPAPGIRIRRRRRA